MEGSGKKSSQDRLPPYVGFSTWRKVVTGLVAYTPSRFDSSYFDSLKLSGTTRSMLKGSLVYLGLMSPDGFPTERLHRLVKSKGDEQKNVLQAIVRSAYGSLFNQLDLERATLGQLREYFRANGASGDIGRKCLAFFLAIAREAGIPLSPHPGRTTLRKGGKRGPYRTAPRERPGRMEHESFPWVRLLLEKFPNLDPNWADDVKKKWFDDFGRLHRELMRGTTLGHSLGEAS